MQKTEDFICVQLILMIPTVSRHLRLRMQWVADTSQTGVRFSSFFKDKKLKLQVHSDSGCKIKPITA